MELAELDLKPATEIKRLLHKEFKMVDYENERGEVVSHIELTFDPKEETKYARLARDLIELLSETGPVLYTNLEPMYGRYFRRQAPKDTLGERFIAYTLSQPEFISKVEKVGQGESTYIQLVGDSNMEFAFARRFPQLLELLQKREILYAKNVEADYNQFFDKLPLETGREILGPAMLESMAVLPEYSEKIELVWHKTSKLLTLKNGPRHDIQFAQIYPYFLEMLNKKGPLILDEVEAVFTSMYGKPPPQGALAAKNVEVMALLPDYNLDIEIANISKVKIVQLKGDWKDEVALRCIMPDLTRLLTATGPLPMEDLSQKFHTFLNYMAPRGSLKPSTLESVVPVYFAKELEIYLEDNVPFIRLMGDDSATKVRDLTRLRRKHEYSLDGIFDDEVFIGSSALILDEEEDETDEAEGDLLVTEEEEEDELLNEAFEVRTVPKEESTPIPDFNLFLLQKSSDDLSDDLNDDYQADGSLLEFDETEGLLDGILSDDDTAHA